MSRFIALLALITASFGMLPPAQAAPDLTEQTTLVDSIERRYWLYVPFATTEGPAPLVLILHGSGGSGERMYKTSDMQDIADREGFIIAYPDGATEEKDGRETWDIGRSWENQPNEQSGPWDDIAFMRRIIAETADRYKIDRTRVYAAGISRGGMLAYRMACEMADELAAISVLAGTMEVAPEECNPAASIPVLHIHGTQDKVVPFTGGDSWKPAQDAVAFWQDRNRCGEKSDLTYNSAGAMCRTYQDCAPGSALELCLVQNHGHGWPGRPAMNWHQEAGIPINEDFPANEKIWQFLSQYSTAFQKQK